MESYSANAEQLKKELHAIQNRSVEIDSNNKSHECFKLLFNEEFYIFPCMHGFHRQCLLDAIRKQPTTDRERWKALRGSTVSLEIWKQPRTKEELQEGCPVHWILIQPVQSVRRQQGQRTRATTAQLDTRREGYQGQKEGLRRPLGCRVHLLWT